MNDDLSAKLNELMSDPEKLRAVMSVVSSVMQTQKSSTDGAAEPPPAPPEVPVIPVAKAVPSPAKKDDRAELLRALKPFLGEDRRGKVDKILRVMSVAELAGLFMKE